MYLPLLTVTTFFVYTQVFLKWNEQRPTLVQLDDKFLKLFPTYNTWFPVTTLQQISHLYYIYLCVQGYVPITETLWSWNYLIWLRCFCMFLCPLKAPKNTQPLYDFTQSWVTRKSQPFMNDLMFSGHLSACCIMGLTSQQPIFYYFAAIIGFLMLFSKTHYTIDLVIAPMASYCVYNLSV